MMIDPDRRVIWWHNPRTAGRSILAALQATGAFHFVRSDTLLMQCAQAVRPTRFHETVAFCGILGIDAAAYTHLVNVRHPYDRFLSGVAEMTHRHRAQLTPLFDPDDLTAFVDFLAHLAARFAHDNLLDLLHQRRGGWDWQIDIAWHTLTRQTTLRSGPDGTPIPMRLIRYEQLESDFRRHMIDLGYAVSIDALPHIGPTRRRTWRGAFADHPAARQFVDCYFAADFAAYGYAMGS